MLKVNENVAIHFKEELGLLQYSAYTDFPLTPLTRPCLSQALACPLVLPCCPQTPLMWCSAASSFAPAPPSRQPDSHHHFLWPPSLLWATSMMFRGGKQQIQATSWYDSAGTFPFATCNSWMLKGPPINMLERQICESHWMWKVMEDGGLGSHK